MLKRVLGASTRIIDYALAVKKITFTGSTAVGSLIAQEAGKHLKPVLLELGGKGNCVVLDETDLGKAAQAALIGAFMHV
jgi:acyl-CoA reductase-like NAD-dependent aldehyde dehydrogenase